MILLAQLTRYQDYTSRMLVESQIDENTVENMLEIARAKYMVEHWTGKEDRVHISKARAAMDESIQELMDKHATVQAQRMLYGVMNETLGRDAAIASRELTRRLGREPVERRVDRYTP